MTSPPFLQCGVPSGLMTQGGSHDHFCMTHSRYLTPGKEQEPTRNNKTCFVKAITLSLALNGSTTKGRIFVSLQQRKRKDIFESDSLRNVVTVSFGKSINYYNRDSEWTDLLHWIDSTDKQQEIKSLVQSLHYRIIAHHLLCTVQVTVIH